MNMPPPLSSSKPVNVIFLSTDTALQKSIHERLSRDVPLTVVSCCRMEEMAPALARQRTDVVLAAVFVMRGEVARLLREVRQHPAGRICEIIVIAMDDHPDAMTNALAAGADDAMVSLPGRAELVARIVRSGRRVQDMAGRDEAMESLCQSQQELLDKNGELTRLNEELNNALSQVSQFRGIISICCHCKRIRDDMDQWQEIEAYVGERADVHFSHGLCPECYSHERSEVSTPHRVGGLHPADIPPPPE